MTNRSRVAVATGRDRIEAVRKAFDYLGGIGKWVKPGHKVLLKPNMMSPQGSPGVTHMDTIKALVMLCKEAGAREVMVGENSVCGMPTQKCWGFRGFHDAIEHIGARVVYFDQEPWVYRINLQNHCLKDMHVPKSLDEADVWITVPVAKTHEACDTTLGIKNSHGILADEDKARHHRGRPESGTSLWEKFVDMVALAKPHLNVVDMYYAMEGQGPAFGDLVDMKLIVAGDDMVAADAVTECLMGFDNLEAPLTRIAHKRGLGIADMQGIEVVGEKIENHRRKFIRAKWHPDQDSPVGLTILAGDVCHGGCQMLLRYLIDTSRLSWLKDERVFGPVYVLVGDNPPPPPEDKFVLVFGDCAIYSSWHYPYRRMKKAIGPWWKRRPGYADVPGCCPLQLAWLRAFANLLQGYAPMVGMMDGVEIMEARQYNFAEGVPLSKNPRRWTWDKEFARRYAREIAASNPPPYIYAANECVKGDRLNGRNPNELDVFTPRHMSEVLTVEDYGRLHRSHQEQMRRHHR